jgi:hypothetical protein
MTYVRARGNGGIYFYFACIGRVTGTGCRQPYVSADVVERKVAAKYAAVKFEQAGCQTTGAWLVHNRAAAREAHRRRFGAPQAA